MERFFRLIVGVLFALGLVACGGDKDSGEGAKSGTGITGQQWKTTNSIGSEAFALTYEFTAGDNWTAQSSLPEWCRVTSSSGASGKNTLAISVDKNTTSASRTALITVRVAGYSSAKFSIVQATSVISGPDADINQWMAGYMKTHYLWNSAMNNLTLDYSLGYQQFLSKVLIDIAAQGDINHDDGHWENGQRKYFYSNIQRLGGLSVNETRGTRLTETGTGVEYMIASRNPAVANTYVLVLAAIAPKSPAGTAGYKRGTTVVKVNNQNISNYNTAASQLLGQMGTVSVTTADWSGSAWVNEKTASLSSATYNDDPVWVHKVLTATNGDKVGYLCYNSFNYYYDQSMINAFSSFAGVKELILDLRYNGGGHVISSCVLGTLITGNSKLNQIYSKTTYNASRTAAGETAGYYKIGDAAGLGYPILTQALAGGLGLTRIYVLCTSGTASASELVICGLRGLDVEVRLIGETTNGKNVGMEPKSMSKGGYTYEFAPITFYSENAKGFKDYGNGFAPDVVVDESAYPMYNFGDTNDKMLSVAMQWINSGSKPSVLQTRTNVDTKVLPRPAKALDGMIAVEEYPAAKE